MHLYFQKIIFFYTKYSFFQNIQLKLARFMSKQFRHDLKISQRAINSALLPGACVVWDELFEQQRASYCKTFWLYSASALYLELCIQRMSRCSLSEYGITMRTQYFTVTSHFFSFAYCSKNIHFRRIVLAHFYLNLKKNSCSLYCWIQTYCATIS